MRSRQAAIFFRPLRTSRSSPGRSRSTHAIALAARYSAKFFSGVMFSLMNSPMFF
ncbi:hypothetical protein [Bradyrhizobium sp. SHOUNA76]|uniref:hypothetical protein n=1 Tax=Bradyrhizobium sp. SHOUNA76 TaxID=2908927 RepID=UPI003857B831